MDHVALLDQGFAWTAARIALVSPDRLDLPTPCSRWTLRELLDHTIGSLTALLDAVTSDGRHQRVGSAAAPLGPSTWDRAIAELAATSRRAWEAPGIMERSIQLPIGEVSGSVAASVTLLECVVHGWDIGQANGEPAAIPGELARPILAFARQAISDGSRGDHFAADLAVGDTPSEQLVAYLGRKPR